MYWPRCSVNTAKIDGEIKTAATILENQATEHLKAFVMTYTHSYTHFPTYVHAHL